jgi:hypothetical protein
MAINSRFSRRRDGLVRLKVRATGEELVLLERSWPVRYKVRTKEGVWASELTIEPQAMRRFFGVVRGLGGAWETFSVEKERRWEELGVREVNVAVSEFGDPQLRTLVRTRLTAPGVLVIDELGIGNGRVRADVAGSGD